MASRMNPPWTWNRERPRRPRVARPTPSAPLAALLALAPVTLWADTATNAAPLLGAELPDVGSSVLRLAGSLVFVLALFLGGVWCVRNWQRLSLHRGRPSELHVIEIKPLGNRQALYLVGYRAHRFLVAASPAGIRLLTSLPADSASDLSPTLEAPKPPENAGPDLPFVATLEKAMGANR